MNISFIVSLQDTSFVPVARGNWQSNITTLVSLGFTIIELAVRDASLIDRSLLKKVLAGNNLEVAAIGTGQAYLDDKLSLSSLDPGIRKAAIERVKQHLDLAAELKSKIVIGLIRGSGVENKEKNKQYLTESLDQICAVADTLGTPVLLEPINRYETSLINNVEEALELIKTVKNRSLRLMVDTFHMNIEEPGFATSINLAGPQLAHVHIADSDRWYPGHGHIDFNNILELLGEINYNGSLSAEILPNPTFEAAAENTINYLTKLMKGSGTKI